MSNNHFHSTHSKLRHSLITLAYLSALLISQILTFFLTACGTRAPVANIVADAEDTTIARESAAKGLDYLREVMDYFHRVFWVYEDVSSPAHHFHAWAKFTGGNGDATMNGS